jgi:putative transcriptional regulator
VDDKPETQDSRLRAERKRRRLSVKHVALSVGYDPSNLSRLELGQQTPPKDVARKLHEFYGGRVPLADIYDPLFRAEVGRRRP